MNISDFLNKAFGVTDRLEAVTAKLEADHKAQLDAKDMEIAELRAWIEVAPNPEAITELEGKITALTARAEAAEAEVAKLPEKVNAESARLIASNGFQGTVDTVLSKNNEELKKADLSNLTGLAKVTAAFKAKAEKKP